VSASSARWMSMIARLPCVVCVSLGQESGQVEIHHVAENSGLRSDYAVVPLCAEHHRGQSGLHGMGPKAFIRLYRPPGDSEYGLMVWTAEQLEKLLWETGRRIAA
jgi:hypothetical protein